MDLRRNEFRRLTADGERQVVPFDTARGSELFGDRWHRDTAVARIPREDWWCARFTNILFESFGQWIGEGIIDYETPTIMWFIRQAYWAGNRDGMRAAKQPRK